MKEAWDISVGEGDSGSKAVAIWWSFTMLTVLMGLAGGVVGVMTSLLYSTTLSAAISLIQTILYIPHTLSAMKLVKQITKFQEDRVIAEVAQ